VSAQRGSPGGGDLYSNVGDTANFHPHLHGLITKGGFDEGGIFHPLLWIDTQKMAILFKDKLFAMLIQEGKISQELASKISSWPHSGFNIHNEVQIDADDEKGKETLAQYIVKAPVSQERMIYDREKQSVICRSKKGAVSYDPLDWLDAISSHIPDKGTQNVHYYGFYSNKSRGIREKSEQKLDSDFIAPESPPPKKVCRKKWAELIKKVYEISPLECPKCHHEMRIIAIIDQREIVEKILKHLDLWHPLPHAPPPINKNEYHEITYDYTFFDSLAL